MKKAFTLIELLVVIAIIAILAAILFPVFAQAKVAAKKTQDISNEKQIATSVMIYSTDYDDLYPLAFASDSTGTFTFSYIDTPADWDPTVSATYHNRRRHVFPNSTMSYIKNKQIFASPGGNEEPLSGWVYTAGLPFFNNGYHFNGLLTAYSQTAVNDVAKLRMLTMTQGNHNVKGATYAQPSLICNVTTSPCQYVPSTATCSSARNGEWSELTDPAGRSMWVFGQGVNAVYADTHAKFTRVAGAAVQFSDYRNDFWARYNAGGKPTWNEWQDNNFCHTMLFMPDFDFENFGTPNFY
ncbi:MAG: prepilin-type N-terminal cleavage/methylation domain-containing protein [Fimbriimonadaceae bacterium]|nr:MAG: prepilin-type N-terminal cleavage/methylation domain-containing protein [Fimbriimonadaceae bacterium]